MNNQFNNILKEETVNSLISAASYAKNNWDYISGISGEGPIKEFEQEAIKITGGKYAIGLTNCTSALITALLAIGIKNGDEVILPALSWGQTLSPVLLLGASPVFADIEKNSVCIDTNSIQKLITKKTKAIIAVHLYGISSDVVELEKISKQYKIPLIFDSAQLLSSNKNDRKIGAFGDFVAFSFGRNKVVTAGEGGLLVCNKRKYFEKALLISQHPLRAHKQINNFELRNSIDSVCLNFRMNPFSAVVGVSELKYLNVISKANVLIKKHTKDILNLLNIKYGDVRLYSYFPNIVIKIKSSEVKAIMKKLDKLNLNYDIENPLFLYKTKTMQCNSFWGRKINPRINACTQAEELIKFNFIILKQKEILNFSVS